MHDEINILILSCGTRNKIVQYFKKELNGKGAVMATDCSKLAPALYDADRYFVVPRMDSEGYLEVVLSICKENKIKAIISLIDPELSLLAKHKDAFLNIGVLPIISEYDEVEMCFDKYKMYNFLHKNGFKTPRSYTKKEKFNDDLEKKIIQFPVFVKPIKGSASLNINKVISKEEINLLFDRYDNLMIQEYMSGTEYGVDVYIDMLSDEPVAIFTKEKILMKAGETDKSVSMKDEKLFELVKMFVKKAHLKGIIDIDIFKKDGEYFISEVNPRFGGGYPHAYECGVNIPKMIINNIVGVANNIAIGVYEINRYMMKYNEIKIIKA